MNNEVSKMNNIDPGYKFSVEVLLNLDHDRYKTYFAQYIVLQLGVFTAQNIDKLSNLTSLLSAVGISICILWFFTLYKIYADIRKFWKIIKEHESKLNQKIKIWDTRDQRRWLLGSGWLMLFVPILFIIVHVAILRCT